MKQRYTPLLLVLFSLPLYAASASANPDKSDVTMDVIEHDDPRDVTNDIDLPHDMAAASGQKEHRNETEQHREQAEHHDDKDKYQDMQDMHKDHHEDSIEEHRDSIHEHHDSMDDSRDDQHDSMDDSHMR